MGPFNMLICTQKCNFKTYSALLAFTGILIFDPTVIFSLVFFGCNIYIGHLPSLHKLGIVYVVAKQTFFLFERRPKEKFPFAKASGSKLLLEEELHLL